MCQGLTAVPAGVWGEGGVNFLAIPDSVCRGKSDFLSLWRKPGGQEMQVMAVKDLAVSGSLLKW